MSLFKKKIICSYCQSNFKSKLERGKRKYICSRYDNYGMCKRIPIEEDFLIDVIQRRFQRELSHQEIRECVEKIVIEDKLLLEIHFFDKLQPPIIFGKNFIRY